jgi:hypothetical protein
MQYALQHVGSSSRCPHCLKSVTFVPSLSTSKPQFVAYEFTDEVHVCTEAKGFWGKIDRLFFGI